MDRLSLDEQLELLRADEPEVVDARRAVAEDKALADRSTRIQAFDTAVGSAVRRVAVPFGFAERVAVRIAKETTSRAVSGRRYFVLGGVSSALILSLLIGLFLWRWPDPTWTSPRVAAAAAAWYSHRMTIPPTTETAPPFPHVGLRENLALGFRQDYLLKKDAAIYRLESPAGDHAVAIIVSAAWFPGNFDPSPTYVIVGDVSLEVRFLTVPGEDEYCIFVSPTPKAFEAKANIF